MAVENVQWAAKKGMESWRRDSKLPRADHARVIIPNRTEVIQINNQSEGGMNHFISTKIGPDDHRVWGRRSERSVAEPNETKTISRSDKEVSDALLNGSSTDEDGMVIGVDSIKRDYLEGKRSLPTSSIIVDLGRGQ